MPYSIVAGDLVPDLNLTAKVNGAPKSLTDAVTIQMLWMKPDGTETLVDLVAIDLNVGRVKRVWEDGDTDQPGRHAGRIVVTWDGDRTQTFPSNGTWFYWT